jgi:hypothetical protein
LGFAFWRETQKFSFFCDKFHPVFFALFSPLRQFYKKSQSLILAFYSGSEHILQALDLGYADNPGSNIARNLHPSRGENLTVKIEHPTKTWVLYVRED